VHPEKKNCLFVMFPPFSKNFCSYVHTQLTAFLQLHEFKKAIRFDNLDTSDPNDPGFILAFSSSIHNKQQCLDRALAHRFREFHAV
jgi:hypothetical protein